MNRYSFIYLLFVVLLHGCSDSFEERIAEEYGVPVEEVNACLSAYGNIGAPKVLEQLSASRMPFPFSYFSDDCYDAIKYSKSFEGSHLDYFHAKEMGWSPEGEEYSRYMMEKKIAESKKAEKAEKETLKRIAEEQKRAEGEYISNNKEYVSLLLSAVKHGGDGYDLIVESFVDFFYFKKIEEIKSTTKFNEFHLADYLASKREHVSGEIESSPTLVYDGNTIWVTLGGYDFENKRFELIYNSILKEVTLDVPCLHWGLRHVCLDGKRRDGRWFYSSVPVGTLPEKIIFEIQDGVPRYLYAPEVEARNIRSGGQLRIDSDLTIISNDLGRIGLRVEAARIVDSEGVVVAEVCESYGPCREVYLGDNRARRSPVY